MRSRFEMLAMVWPTDRSIDDGFGLRVPQVRPNALRLHQVPDRRSRHAHRFLASAAELSGRPRGSPERSLSAVVGFACSRARKVPIESSDDDHNRHLRCNRSNLVTLVIANAVRPSGMSFWPDSSFSVLWLRRHVAWVTFGQMVSGLVELTRASHYSHSQ